MSFFKDIENFFTKEIPKFVTKTVPSVFEKETYAPDLKPMRASVERLKTEVQRARDEFYVEQANLNQAEARYLELSERYDTIVGAVSRHAVSPSLVRELNDTEKTLRDIAKVSRTVTSVATLGLAELAFIHADIAEERRKLTRQQTVLSGTKKRFVAGIRNLVKARKAFETEINKVEAELAAKGIDAGPSAVSEATAADARLAARRKMAGRLLGLETDLATIKDLTGFSEAELASIAPVPPEAEDGSEEPDAMTDDEKSLLREAQ